MIIQYKPTKSQFLNYHFNFLCLLHVSNSRVHLQEDGCIYWYGIVRITCISIYNRLPEDEPSASKHVEDTKIFKLKYTFREGALPYLLA